MHRLIQTVCLSKPVCIIVWTESGLVAMIIAAPWMLLVAVFIDLVLSCLEFEWKHIIEKFKNK
jgi:uncharacterized membrane protein YczE